MPTCAIIAVDLDGTLLVGDSFLKACAAAARVHPLSFCRRAAAGLPALKAWMYPYLPVQGLVFHQALISWLLSRRSQGARLYLASAAPEYFLQAVAAQMPCGPLFEGVLGSTPMLNLRGGHKARALVEKFGPKGFAYVGNSQADLPVWQAAAAAYNVNPSKGLQRAASRLGLQLQLIAPQPQHAWMETYDTFRRFFSS